MEAVSLMASPPLPPGYTLDSGHPPPPAGYTLDASKPSVQTGTPGVGVQADNRNGIQKWWDHTAQSAAQGFQSGVDQYNALEQRVTHDPKAAIGAALNPGSVIGPITAPIVNWATQGAGAALAPLVDNGNNQEGVVTQADVNAVHHGQNAPLDSRYITNAQRENIAGNIAVGMIPIDRVLQGAGVAADVAANVAKRVIPPRSVAAVAVKPPNAFATNVAKFDAAGVTPSLAALGGNGAASATKFAAENPFTGGAARGRLQTSINEAGQSAANLAGQYGSPASRSSVGADIQTGVTRFAKGGDAPASVTTPTQQSSFSDKAGALYDRVFGGLDMAMAGKTGPRQTVQVADPSRWTTGFRDVQTPGSQISTPNTTAVLHDVLNPGQSADINSLISDPTMKAVAAKVEAGQGDLSFQDLRNLRTWVRTQQAKPAISQTIDSASLGRLESALTSDIYSNASTLGYPSLVHQLRRADQFYAAGQQRISTALASAFKAPTPEAAYDGIVGAATDGGKADINRLLGVKRSLAPAEWGDVAATALQRMGKPTPGTGAVADGDQAFSISSFVTNYNKLSPQGRDVLFGSRGGGGAQATGLRAQLDNLADVADRLKGVERAANSSKTAVVGQAAATIGGLTNHITLGPTILALAGEWGLGEIMTHPRFVRWAVGTARAPTAALPGRLAALDALAKTDPKIAAVAPRLRLQLQGSQGLAVSAQQQQGQPTPVGP